MSDHGYKHRPVPARGSAAALLALGVIGVRPSWHVGATAHDAILSTPGADAAAAGGLADSLGGAPVYTSLAEAYVHRAELARPHVIGWGLDAGDWARLESIPIVFHPVTLPSGFVRTGWPAQVVLGDRVTVDGVLARRGTAPAWVELADLSGIVDTAAVDSAGAFHLEAEPRAVGDQLYSLRVRGTAIAETLGVHVVPPPVWRVLMLESAPRPETTVLRDWLARRRSVVAVRSMVSRDRVHVEFVNRAGTSLNVLSGALLSQFDLVVIDGRTLARLGSLEHTVLQRAVDVDGLGVLIVPDTILTDPFFFDFALQRTGNLDERQVRAVWRERGGREPRAPAVAAEPYALTDRFGTEMLISDGFGRGLAQVEPRGAGRVTLSLIIGTARWRRSGLADTYATYWSRLLAATATANRDAPRWTIATSGPWIVGRPVAIEAATGRPLRTALVAGPAAQLDTVFLARDSAASGRWRGIFWPRSPGWYRVDGDAGPAMYVQNTSSWIGVRATARLVATQRAQVELRSAARATRATLPVPASPSLWGGRSWCFSSLRATSGPSDGESRPAARSRADTAT